MNIVIWCEENITVEKETFTFANGFLSSPTPESLEKTIKNEIKILV